MSFYTVHTNKQTHTFPMEINIYSNSSFGINNAVIEKVNSFKYLGFIIHRDLKLKENLEYICRKIGKKTSFFKRLRNKVSMLTSINIYNIMLKPRLEYKSTILYIILYYKN